MPRPKIVLNHGEVRALLSGAGVSGFLESRMGQVEAAARSSAPVATGAYRDSIHTVTEQHRDRVVVRVVADVDYAMAVEANTGNLARALDGGGGVRYTTKAGKTRWASQAQVDNWTRGR